MKKISLLLVASFFAISSFAQILKRYDHDTTQLNFGTRPKKGDKSLMLNIALHDSSMKVVKLNDLLKLSDKLVFRKYLTDRTVFRISARLSRDSKFSKGTIADSGFYNPLVNPHLTKNKMNISSSQVILMPGLEKHFSNSNVFDVYYGADMGLGIGNNQVVSNLTFSNGDYSNYKAGNTYSVVGLGAFAGFNVFVGKLPLSLGLEYGWGGLWTLGNRSKISKQEQITVGATTNAYTTEYYAENADALGVIDNNQYAKLNRREASFGLNQTVKFTANIFFR